MQKENGNKNLLRSNTRNQRQQIEPHGDIENRRVRDKIYCKDAIVDGGHLSLLPNQSALLDYIGHAGLLRRSFSVDGTLGESRYGWNSEEHDLLLVGCVAE